MLLKHVNVMSEDHEVNNMLFKYLFLSSDGFISYHWWELIGKERGKNLKL
ncbi:hypothetical protein Sjap_012944 [Stephania japonica]|uniref:Uncharacterized protein n=1 Tax=Stephania japonica TaxID=461633 RepID=A0AAP0IWU6_9MAGN